MVISARLQDCGTESRVDGEWLVYSNKLLVFPAVPVTSTGSVIVGGQTIVVPIECRYKRESSTSHRSSSIYQQGEAGFLKASEEAPLHPILTLYNESCVALKPDLLSRPRYKFISKHGCMMDTLLPDSSPRFLPQDQANRLCFSFKMFNFNQTSPEQMFISCHLRATLKQKSPHRHNRACFFHKPTFRWRSIEGDIALCECCNTDCSGLTGVKNHGHPETDETFEAHRTAGRLHVVHQSNWTGELSGFQSVEKTLLQVQSLVLTFRKFGKMFDHQQIQRTLPPVLIMLNEPPTIKYSPVRRLRSLMKMFCVGSLAPGCLVPVFPYSLSGLLPVQLLMKKVPKE